jgi:hypothetical protein
MILETLLAETFGVPVDDPRVKGIIREMEARRLVDHWAVVRIQIAADPETDWRVIQRRYHCSRGFVYKVWNERRLIA